jgi:hypothetical protein
MNEMWLMLIAFPSHDSRPTLRLPRVLADATARRLFIYLIEYNSLTRANVSYSKSLISALLPSNPKKNVKGES